MLNPDFKEFIKSLNENKVRYMVVGGYENSGAIDHIHWEIRGPGKWAGPSLNPLQFMTEMQKLALIEISTNQKIQVEMGRFADDFGNIFSYPPPKYLNPDKIYRNSSKDEPAE